ncbi:MAG: hypothetical protein ABR985_17865 [Methanotrichaceae archaeon]|jgi:carbamate kinase
MGPKVEAASIYAESTGYPALITNVERLSDALKARQEPGSNHDFLVGETF